MTFLHTLYDRCLTFAHACLTFTLIHPDGQHPTPSRHVPLSDLAQLSDTLSVLHRANLRGWGAFFAVGLRRKGLTRWRRGGLTDVVALPALFVDVDNPSDETRLRLESMSPMPSCLVFSGGGYHAYWWLETPLSNMELARGLLRTLATGLDGDPLSPAQSLRLPNTVNTKPQRAGAPCQILSLNTRRYLVEAFPQPVKPSHQSISAQTTKHTQTGNGQTLNPDLLTVVTQSLVLHGYRPSGDWLTGTCPYPHRHTHADAHPSFGFNIRTGYGHCYRCGSFTLKILCSWLNLQPSDYGGFYERR